MAGVKEVKQIIMEHIVERGRADSISFSLIALMFLTGILYMFMLPDEIKLYPGTYGEGVSPKAFGLFILPFTGILLYAVMTFIPPFLNPRRKKFPEKTAKYIRPAALAYFLYTQISIIALNKSGIDFSSSQNLSVLTGIGILYAAAQIQNSKSVLVPRLFSSTNKDELAIFNENLGKALSWSSIIIFLGFFTEKQLPLLIVAFILLVVSLAAYYAYAMKKKDEFSAIKQEIEHQNR